MYVVYLIVYRGKLLPPFYIGSTSLKNIKEKYYGSIVSKKYKDIFNSEKKINPELFSRIILSEHSTRQEAMSFELVLQKKFNVVKSNLFFNQSYASVGGMCGMDVSGNNNPMFGKKHSEATKELIRKKRGNERRYIPTDAHRKITSKTHKNKIVSEETRKKISEKSKGRNLGGKLSEETRKKISLAKKGKNLGKNHTEETKKKISLANKGKEINEETRKKISDSKKGKKRGEFSIEWRRKLSESKKGLIKSAETRAKLSKPRNSKKSICPYCQISGGGGNMKRYHFENCKKK